MERLTFALRLHEAAAAAREFAQAFLDEKLPDAMRFRVRLNCSYDGNPLRSDETLYPEDSSLERAKGLLSCREEEVVDVLWREDKIPEWIDISVVNEVDRTTILELKCCGRFTSDERLLYHAWQGRPPFQAVGPTLPPKYQKGQKFSIHHRTEAWKPADLEALEPHRDKVWSLELIGEEFDDSSLQELPEFAALHLVQLRQTRISAGGVGFLKRHRMLRVLNIFPASVLDLTELPRLRSLTGLNVYNAQSVRCNFGSLWPKLPSLNHLMLACAGTLHLTGRLPRSTAFIDLRAANLEGDFAVPAKVETLGLHLQEASDSEIAKLLKNLKALDSLNLSGTPVTDHLLIELTNRWALKRLNVSQTNITKAAAEKFAAAHVGLVVPGPGRTGGALTREAHEAQPK